mmetsp:Transcript_18003/g.27216  ORF Transcript_18003/g.27216 Transcript_18003/m.27216 type:complete len:121 (-) Transcript_18003:3-365(-)
MVWEVSVRPYHNCEPYIKAFTSSIVQTVGWNFKAHVELDKDEEFVEIATTTNGEKTDTPSLSFPIRRDSWIGRVVYANQKDNRPVILDQALDSLQPWKWGILPSEKGDATYSWTTGVIEI